MKEISATALGRTQLIYDGQTHRRRRADAESLEEARRQKSPKGRCCRSTNRSCETDERAKNEDDAAAVDIRERRPEELAEREPKAGHTDAPVDLRVADLEARLCLGIGRHRRHNDVGEHKVPEAQTAADANEHYILHVRPKAGFWLPYPLASDG